MVQVGSYSAVTSQSSSKSLSCLLVYILTCQLIHRWPQVFLFRLYNLSHLLNICSRNTSPFWQKRPTNGRNTSSKTPDPNAVFGASYSHADMLKFDSLWGSLLSSSMRVANKRLKIVNAFKFPTPDSYILKEQFPLCYTISTPQSQRHLVTPKTAHLFTACVTNDECLGGG